MAPGSLRCRRWGAWEPSASVRGIAVNQTGTLVTLTIDNVNMAVTRSLIRLSDGATLYGTNLTLPLGNFAANSNGSQLAVAGQPVSTDPFAIYLMKPDGTQKMQVAAIPTGTYVSEITFAPDDQTLYFVAAAPLNLFHVGNGVLYKLTAGGTPVAVANINAPIYSVHTSRDGTKLAFLTYSEAADLSSLTFTPYTLNADGTGLAKGAATTTNNDKVDPAVRGGSRPGISISPVGQTASTSSIWTRKGSRRALRHAPGWKRPEADHLHRGRQRNSRFARRRHPFYSYAGRAIAGLREQKNRVDETKRNAEVTDPDGEENRRTTSKL